MQIIKCHNILCHNYDFFLFPPLGSKLSIFLFYSILFYSILLYYIIMLCILYLSHGQNSQCLLITIDLLTVDHCTCSGYCCCLDTFIHLSRGDLYLLSTSKSYFPLYSSDYLCTPTIPYYIYVVSHFTHINLVEWLTFSCICVFLPCDFTLLWLPVIYHTLQSLVAQLCKIASWWSFCSLK